MDQQNVNLTGVSGPKRAPSSEMTSSSDTRDRVNEAVFPESFSPRVSPDPAPSGALAPDDAAFNHELAHQDVLVKKKYRSKFLKRPILASLQKLMIAYLVVWSISPPLAIDMIYRYIALACAGGWLVIEMSHRRKFERIHGFAIAFMLAVIAIAYAETNGSINGVMQYISHYMLVIGFLMNYSYRDRWDEFKLLVPLVLVLWIFFNIITTKELIIDPTLARKIVRADEAVYPYMRRGVGGDALLYSQVLVFPIMLAWIISTLKRSFSLFLIGFVWLGSFLTFLFHAGYSIAITSVISSTIIFFTYKRKSVLPAFFITLSFIVLIVVLIGYVDSVREWLIDIFKGTKVASKVRDIYDSIHGADVADSIQSRIDRYFASIETIITYPFIGGLWWAGGGGHSAILDTFAKYGVWGGWVFCKMLFCVAINLKQNTKKPRDNRMSNALLSSLALVMLLDSLPFDMVFPIIIVSPILIHQIQKWDDYEELEPVKKLRTKFQKRPEKNRKTAQGRA